RATNASLLTTSPARSVSAMRMSSARLPILTACPPCSRRRSRGNKLNGPKVTSWLMLSRVPLPRSLRWQTEAAAPDVAATDDDDRDAFRGWAGCCSGHLAARVVLGTQLVQLRADQTIRI